MGRVDASRAPCFPCLMGGTEKRLANRATHFVTFVDGKRTLVCERHMKQFTGAGASAEVIPEGFVWVSRTDAEMRDLMRVATYDEREQRRQLDRDARTVVVKVQIEDLSGRQLHQGQ